MDKILEAIKKLLPEADVSDVSAAVHDMLKEAKAELEKEYNEKLEEAYAELSSELKNAEQTAESGYQEAYEIIADLRNRLESTSEEYKNALYEGYDKAHDLIKEERAKVEKLELEMYEEYDKKLNEMKEFIVDKVDAFLEMKGSEIYEQAKRDVLNDPRLSEHKVVLDKIVDLTSEYISEEDFVNVSSHKLEEANKQIEDVKSQLKILEARNIRLSTENTKLNESVRQSNALLTEQKVNEEKTKKTDVIKEQNERTTKVENVSGRGHVKTDDGAIIAENVEPLSDEFANMRALAGLGGK